MIKKNENKFKTPLKWGNWLPFYGVQDQDVGNPSVVKGRIQASRFFLTLLLGRYEFPTVWFGIPIGEKPRFFKVFYKYIL
ncbi:hypothetical protein BVC71_01360 [Marivivens niveibacter]|uniref:Uncharacterized protein n=1 Tax=Marivivens niveibacter TaxID=1930667 RepID=A0A251X1Z6_9RHOB|nr:hypothetical protein BVC71_01360 [Marivivens niveibacter]